MRSSDYLLKVVVGLVILLFALALFAQTETGRRLTAGLTLPKGAPQGNVDAGRDLAVTYCAECHNVVEQGASSVAAAPPFRELAKRYPVEYLAEALAEGITVDHRSGVEMPEFEFEVTQIDDLLAYLESLR